MEVHSITPTLKLIALQPGIPGYDRFFGAYVFRGERNAIVDVGPATAMPSLITALADLGLSPTEIDYIVLTHIHIDHSGGVGAAVRQMGRAKVVAHSRARPHLIDPTRLWEASLKTLGDLATRYGIVEPVPEDRIVSAADNMKLDLGEGLELDVILTPGHASHHLSLFDRASSVLIAGEAAGVCIDGTIRVSTPPPFAFEEALSSIDRLIALGPEKVCYAHFGCYDDGPHLLNLARERLVSWRDAVAIAVKAGKTPDEIFAALKQEDRSLDYLATLDQDAYAREHKMLVNSIIGLSGQVL